MMMKCSMMTKALLLLLLASPAIVHAYCSSNINRLDMAGIWRFDGNLILKNKKIRFPMKEFTVYPKKEKKKKEEHFLLKLSEDGSFQQTSEDGVSHHSKRGFLKGTWDFLDGRLILAADRPDNNSDDKKEKNKDGGNDTILVGEVVATANQQLQDNPALGQSQQQDQASSSSNSYDVYLSVPNGLVEVGRFTYPRHHPSFFDQPIFKPMPTGSFRLKQVLGNLNTKQEVKPPEPKFHKHHFVDKKFFLTSSPIQHKPKGRQRWSIKYNKFVRDAPPPSPADKKKEEEQKNQKIDIRVMEVQFFGNNTFATVAGLGSSAILRGKWSIIGEERDHLWMQVSRFGFGRSVSGSVYSEGLGLTHNDEKAYWGQIEHVPQSNDDDDDTISDNSSKGTAAFMDGASKQEEETTGKKGLIEVKGSVLDGWGLEPLPVARFTMIEKTDEREEDYDDEDDDDDDGGLIQDKLDRNFQMNDEDNDTNDSYSSPDAFQ
uniref:Uncharacterized protein n=1 Tax=Ditylum brightwellii TaxID=49249 RepID=A0A7S4RKB1_9STRA